MQNKYCYLCGNDQLIKRLGSLRGNTNLSILECIKCSLVFLSSFDHVSDSLQADGIMHVDDALLSVYKIEEFNKFYWYPYHVYFYNKRTLKNLFGEFESINFTINLSQRYGLINHLWWLIKRKQVDIIKRYLYWIIFISFV